MTKKNKFWNFGRGEILSRLDQYIARRNKRITMRDVPNIESYLDKVSRPIRFGELELIIMRYVLTKAEQPEMSPAEFIIGEDHRRGLFARSSPWNTVDHNNPSTLPPEGRWVLAKHNRGTWIDDDPNVICVVVKLKRGLSKVERNKLQEGDPRKHTYTSADEHDNNRYPYCWVTFGVDHFFGQTITEWMYIPD